jgi:hypothetical protein
LGSKIIFFDSCKSNSSSGNLCTDSEILKGINAVYRQEKSRSVLFNFSFGSQTSSPLLLGYVSFVTKFARIYTPDNSDKLPPGLIVAAAGNVTKPPRAKDKEVIKVYPAFYSFEYDELQILSVRSVEQNNQNKDNWRLSDFGYSGLNHPFDISAPGRRVHVPDNRYPVSGTSFATPVVTGALALLQKSGVPIQKLTSCIGEIVNRTPDRRLDLDRFYAALKNLKQFMNCN